MTDYVIKWIVGAILGGVVAFMAWSTKCNLNTFKKYFKKLEDSIAKLSKRTDEQIEDISKDIKELKQGQEDSKETNVAILRDKLGTKIEYHLEEEYCSLHGREVINALYKEFQANGGNGDMDEKVDMVKQLPISKGEWYGRK